MPAIVSALLSLFSPPYGDGTWAQLFEYTGLRFSPPYGDGTNKYKGGLSEKKFSPPYGDKLKSKAVLRKEKNT